MVHLYGSLKSVIGEQHYGVCENKQYVGLFFFSTGTRVCEEYIKVPLEVALMWKVGGHSSGVIQLIDYFELPDFHLLVMERPGTSAQACKDLFDFISDHKRLEEPLARHIFRQVVRTVQECHEAGVIHRDIKDENILIDVKSHQAKLIDFGSGARLHDETYTDFEGKTIFRF